jgi:histidinol-phosphate aminotransferase
VIRPAPQIDAIEPMTPFIGPEQLMLETGRDSLVRLGANESAFGPSPRAVAAMSAQLDQLWWYGDPESLALRDALSKRHGVTAAQIVVGAGIDDLMGLIVRGFVAPGAAALTTRGSYPTFNYHVHGYGGRLVFANYHPDGRVNFDELIEAAKREHPSVIYLANPDNPSGTFAGPGEIARFIEAIPKDAVLMLDEAYADFVEESELIPIQVEDRIVRMRTFSKAYGLAGARIGYAIASERVIGTLQKIRLHYGVNRNAQVGALAALADEAYHRHVVEEVTKARNDYYALAAELGLGAIPSATNFVCIDLGDAGRATKVMNELLRQHGVWIRKPGLPPLDGHVRVSAGTPEMRAAFAEAFRAVVAAIPSASGSPVGEPA